jgi:hypothetical protein
MVERIDTGLKMDTLLPEEEILSLCNVDIVVLQVILAELDDTSVSNLRCSQSLMIMVDNLRNPHYWQSKLLARWLLPPELYFPQPTDWFDCYSEWFYVRNISNDRKDQNAGYYFTLGQLIIYRDLIADRASQDTDRLDPKDEDTALFHRLYFDSLTHMYQGIIQRDDLDKYDNFQVYCKGNFSSSLAVNRQGSQRYVEEQQLNTEELLLAVGSDGGWKILCRMINDMLSHVSTYPVGASKLFTQAVKSSDISHYLLIKSLFGKIREVDANWDIYLSLSRAPQNVSFYYREVPTSNPKTA